MSRLKGLNTSNGSKLLSYIINQDPVLSENIDLPKQGQSIAPIGKIIVDNQRYKNAFINAINLIAVTLVKRNDWNNPWEDFTEQGQINFGQSVREMIVDLVEAQDYNEHMNSATHFLEHEVPEVYNYIHNINFQKFYKVTVNDTEIAMAFTNETNMYDLIQSVYSRLYESYKYDKYQVDKYQLCRRIIDGTVPSVAITAFDSNTIRQNVAIMKGYSNKLTFRSPKYNPAGLRLATSFENQRLIINTEFEGQLSTEVLATSYFLNEADFKTKSALIDGFNDFDTNRLSSLLGSQYVAFTEDELTRLSNVVGMIISDDFFMDYYYSLDTNAESTGATKNTEFYNPESLDNTLWLHAWRIFSTSPFANCIVFTKTASSATAVAVDPSTATVTKGQTAQFTASVTTTGITNKSVQWTVDADSSANGVTINANGLLSIPSSYTTGTQGVYTLAIGTALAEGEVLEIDGIKYTAAAADDTDVKQATAIKALLDANTTFASKYTTTRSSATLTFTEKAGHYGVGKPIIDDSDLSTGAVTEAVTTQGVDGASGTVTVTATSIFNSSVSGTATVTVA